MISAVRQPRQVLEPALQVGGREATLRDQDAIADLVRLLLLFREELLEQLLAGPKAGEVMPAACSISRGWLPFSGRRQVGRHRPPPSYRAGIKSGGSADLSPAARKGNPYALP